MGGQLYLNNGQPQNRSNVCVSGYDSNSENYALSNFENNHGRGYSFKDPHMGQISFPTAEHYLHFQKLTPAAKQANYNMWRNEQNPGTILRGIRDEGSKFFIKDDQYAYRGQDGKFDAPKWNVEKIAVQMQINATKFQQSQDFRNSIQKSIEIGQSLDGKGPVTIIEDTSSLRNGKQPEVEWGTGPGGTGKNILGNTQTAFASLVQNLRIDNNPPDLSTYKTPAMMSVYKEAEEQYTDTFQPTLINIRKASGCNINRLAQPDTSKLSSNLVRPLTITHGQVQQASFSSPPQKARYQSPSFTTTNTNLGPLPNSSTPSLSPRQTTSWQPTQSQEDANQQASSMVKQMMKSDAMRQLDSGIPIVCKGNKNGTLKFAFDNPQDAQVFRKILQDSGFKTTYFGGNDKYPMEHNGKKLDHIVRFENNGNKTCIPEEALEFLKEKFKDDHEKIAGIVEGMGFEKPELEQTLSLR